MKCVDCGASIDHNFQNSDHTESECFAHLKERVADLKLALTEACTLVSRHGSQSDAKRLRRVLNESNPPEEGNG
jgi:hypothetical protein